MPGSVLLSSYNLSITVEQGPTNKITFTSSSPDIILPKYAYILYATNQITWTDSTISASNVLIKCNYKTFTAGLITKTTNNSFYITANFVPNGIAGTSHMTLAGDNSNHLLVHIYLQF